MMYWFLYDFEFGLFVHFRNYLFDFEHFAYLLVDIFGHFFFILDLFSLNFWCMIWNFKLFFHLLWCEYLFFNLDGNLLNYLNILLLINWDFYHIYFLIISDHLFNYFGRDWIRSFNSYWHLNNFTLAVLIRYLFSIWNTLLKIDCKMSSICHNHSLFLFKWNSNTLGSREEDRSVNENIDLTDASSGPE